jgi:hypothetical protein
MLIHTERMAALETNSAESRTLRKHKAKRDFLQQLSDPTVRKPRKPLTPEELAARQKKVVFPLFFY